MLRKRVALIQASRHVLPGLKQRLRQTKGVGTTVKRKYPPVIQLIDPNQFRISSNQFKSVQNQLLRKEGGACVCTRKCVRAAFKAKA